MKYSLKGKKTSHKQAPTYVHQFTAERILFLKNPKLLGEGEDLVHCI